MKITCNIDFKAIAVNQKVYKLENTLLEMEQADIKTEHIFKEGIYERKITIPPWTVLTGAVHKTNYVVRLEKGTIAVNTDSGTKLFTAPCEFTALAGLKRAGRVFEEEVVWIDVYPNPDNCTDIATLTERYYDIKNEDMGDVRPKGTLPSKLNFTQPTIPVYPVPLKISHAKSDFDFFITQLGTTKKLVNNISNISTDLIEMPDGFSVETRNSDIHGKGLFALKGFKSGEEICPGRINGMRTPAGRFINHSPEPNAVTVKKINGDLVALAIKDIAPNDEILIDYRNSMKVNFGIEMEGRLCQVG